MAQLYLVKLDLAEFDSVREFGEHLRQRYGTGSLDLLVNNASIMALPNRTMNSDETKTMNSSKGRVTMNVIQVAEKFCAAWSSLDAEAFSSLFAPNGYYTDIAFGVTRRGRENVREHHKIWRMAVPEFSMMPEHVHASGQVVTVQTICYGKFSGSDLGGSKIKATHKSFRARAIAVLEINNQAEITACTEYYDRTTMPIGEPTPFNDLTWPQNELFVPSTDVRDAG